ncbi:hypothetical protein Dda_3798 [Drechslerella dactyloides]|uniref:Uncharacterized protein n=1 Tax=Drechslerella dactyloides TaxID=74499 RepID=A0AAD6J325_DREDA|nr:hypothetical protein Dda_3798 [Drechslerella dactyloides]
MLHDMNETSGRAMAMAGYQCSVDRFDETMRLLRTTSVSEQSWETKNFDLERKQRPNSNAGEKMWRTSEGSFWRMKAQQ